MTATTARALALEAIGRVIDDGAYSNRLLPSLLARSGLDRRDRAFATELTFGVLRARIGIDATIDLLASRPVARMDRRVANLIRLGVYQLTRTAVPDHAAVAETVAIAGGRERGFVNAVLRRVASNPPQAPDGVSDGDVAIRTGLAPWAVRELRAMMGDDAEAAAAGLAMRAPVCLRPTADPAAFEASLRAAGVGVSAGLVEPTCLLLDGGDPSELPGYAQGAFAIQDQASVFVSKTLGARPGDVVADVCAAPGGKSLALAAVVGVEGTVVAADLRRSRLQAMRREARRLQVAPVPVVHDAQAPALRAGAFPRVLVDAPCSGLGSARRRPELLWRVGQEALPTLAARQLAILTASADLVAPGGRLVYAVCTFPRSETDAVLDVFEGRRSDLRPVETPGPDGPRLRHRLWPHLHGSDGMFVAAFERVS